MLVATHLTTGQRRSIVISDIKPASGSAPAGQVIAAIDRLPISEV